jgi:hypothetical protein
MNGLHSRVTPIECSGNSFDVIFNLDGISNPSKITLANPFFSANMNVSEQ